MNSENMCKLCGNPADKTGSHLLSSFFISNYVNREGAKGRDNELMYTIEDSFYKKNLFLGRKTAGRTDEELANTVGKSIEEIKEIRSEKNSIVVDHLFCTNCESDFGKLEGRFSDKCHKNLLSGSAKSANINTAISFFLLNIWRCSVANGKHESFKLKSILEKAVGNYFLKLFKKHDGLTEPNLSMFPKNIFVELFIYPVENVLEPRDESKFFLFLHPKLKQPYFIMLGRFIVLLYGKKSHLRNTIQDNFGLREIRNRITQSFSNSNSSLYYLSKNEFDIPYKAIPTFLVQLTKNRPLFLLKKVCREFRLKYEIMEPQFVTYMQEYGTSENDEEEVFINIMHRLFEDGTLQSSIEHK